MWQWFFLCISWISLVVFWMCNIEVRVLTILQRPFCKCWHAVSSYWCSSHASPHSRTSNTTLSKLPAASFSRCREADAASKSACFPPINLTQAFLVLGSWALLPEQPRWQVSQCTSTGFGFYTFHYYMHIKWRQLLKTAIWSTRRFLGIFVIWLAFLNGELVKLGTCKDDVYRWRTKGDWPQS